MNYKKTLIIGTLFLMVFSSCSRSLFCTKGEGDIIERQLDIEQFDKLILSGSFDARINQSDSFSIVAQGHENILNDLNLNVSGSTWEADLDERCYVDYELVLYINVPNLSEVELEGSGNIFIDGIFRSDRFKALIEGSGDIICYDSIVAPEIHFEIEGSGDIEAPVDCARLNARIEGSGDMYIDGYAEEQQIDILGSGDYLAFGTESFETRIDILGSGNTEIHALDILDVEIEGSGNVYYIGYPTITSRILGSGKIINKN